MFADRGVQLVVYHGVLLVRAGREGEGGAHLDLSGHVARHVEQDRVAPGAGPHEDGHLVCRGLAGGCRLGACSLLEKRKDNNCSHTCRFLFAIPAGCLLSWFEHPRKLSCKA